MNTRYCHYCRAETRGEVTCLRCGNTRVERPTLTARQIDTLADRMDEIAETSAVEGASRDQRRHWMRTALHRILVQGEDR